jgi:hypothetical protein
MLVSHSVLATSFTLPLRRNMPTFPPRLVMLLKAVTKYRINKNKTKH